MIIITRKNGEWRNNGGKGIKSRRRAFCESGESNSLPPPLPGCLIKIGKSSDSIAPESNKRCNYICGARRFYRSTSERRLSPFEHAGFHIFTLLYSGSISVVPLTERIPTGITDTVLRFFAFPPGYAFALANETATVFTLEVHVPL